MSKDKDITNHAPFYVAVDIETTGLDPERHQILEFAAVAWTNDGPISELPYLQAIVKPEDDIVGEPYALSMNKRLLDELSNGNGRYIEDVLDEFRVWLGSLGVSPSFKTCIVGANFASFDLQFLRQWVAWPDDLIEYRYFDTSTIAACRQGMKSAAKVLGIPDLPGNPHEALYDARTSMWHCQKFILDSGSGV